MFTRPRVLSPVNGSPKRQPFTDLKNVERQEEVKECKGLEGFDWNRSLNIKKVGKARTKPKNKFVVQVSEEKANGENYSPNTKTAHDAFFGSSKLSSSSDKNQAESKLSEDDVDTFSTTLEEESPRPESKDTQHENLLRIAHSLSPQAGVTSIKVKGPSSDLISPPSKLKNQGSMGLVGSPLLNVTQREIEMSPNTPDMSVSPSQQKTPPSQLTYDMSENKDTSSEEKSSYDEKNEQYEQHYENYDENYWYDQETYNQDSYPEHEYHEGWTTTDENADDKQLFYKREKGHFEDKSDEVFSNNTTLHALTPVKLKYSMSVVTEVTDTEEVKSVADSPDSISSRLTNTSNRSYDIETEQLFSKVRHNRIDEVVALLSAGANAKAKDINGNTLLHICAQNNLKKMASIILDHGVDINIENKKGYTGLDYCDNYNFQKLGDWFVQNGGDNSHKQLGL